ncbi:MAG: hypothetical protein ACUVV0_02200 [Anaerolineae bacterium]
MRQTPALRHMFIELARRRQRPGSGSRPEFLRRRTANIAWPDLSAVLSPLKWAVVGAVATRLYMPERATQDLDIAICAEDGPEAKQKLASAGFVYQGELSIGGSSWLSPEGIAIEVLEREEPWLPEALAEAQGNRDAQGLPILPLPYLVLMKFQAGRIQDLADAARMLGQADEKALAEVRALFARYAPADIEDLESLIALGKLEMQASTE